MFHINRKKGKKPDKIISLDGEKAFDKIPTPFLNKNCKNFLNLIKDIYAKSIANIILSS